MIGDDYWVQRQALIDACEGDGTGKLIHPTIGVLTVICTGLTVNDDNTESHITRFILKFSEAGQCLYPSSNTDNTHELTKIVETGDSRPGRFICPD